METVILSTAYFPPISYFCKILRASEVQIENDENFIKQTYRNRCIILGANGPQALTIPINHGDAIKLNIREVKMSFHNRWPQIHFRAIESAYRNAAFYDYYIHDFKPFFQAGITGLLEQNTAILRTCMELLNIDKPIGFTGTFQSEYSNDCRYNLTPKRDLPDFHFSEYHQVFMEKFGFTPNLSILDLIFNAGPESRDILESTRF